MKERAADRARRWRSVCCRPAAQAARRDGLGPQEQALAEDQWPEARLVARHSESRGGDMIALAMQELGLESRPAVQWLADELRIRRSIASSGRCQNRSARGHRRRRKIRRLRPPGSARGGRSLRHVCRGYLLSRGLVLPPPAIMQTIGFHPQCPWGNGHTPALIAAFTPIAAAVPDVPFSDPPVTAIHRIRGRGHENKRMLGSTAGKAIRLAPWWHVDGRCMSARASRRRSRFTAGTCADRGSRRLAV